MLMIQRSILNIVFSNMIKLNSNNKNRKLYKPPPAQDYSKNFCKLYIVIGISLLFISAEFVGGYISGSISVISDAFHLLTDLIGFMVSFGFIYYSRQKPTQKMSFGFHRMELIGALGNLFIIWVLAIFLIYQATFRIIQKQFVKQPIAMLIVGVGGLIINIIMFFVLHSGSHSHGLMSQTCNHAGQNDNRETSQNCTIFCNQILCQDQICLQQNSIEHCHVKQGAQVKIHIHDKNRKGSDEMQLAQIKKSNKDKIQNQNAQSSLHQISDKKKKQHKHQHGQNCNHHKEKGMSQQKQKGTDHKHHDHKHDQKHDHKHDHNHDHQHNHNHENQQGHKHDHQHDHNHQNDHQHESLSMKAAVLHALSDVIQSIGLLISSILIFFFGSHYGHAVTEWNDWHYLDPISTYIFSIIVICSTFPIVKNCYDIMMESTPSTKISIQIRQEFQKCQNVLDVHDLHIWDLRPGKTLLIAHVFAKEGAQRQVLTKLTQICRRKKIYHSTLQIQEEVFKNHDSYILCDHDIH